MRLYHARRLARALRLLRLRIEFGQAREGLFALPPRHRDRQVLWPLGLALAARKEGVMPGTDDYTEENGRHHHDEGQGHDEGDGHSDTEDGAGLEARRGHGARPEYCFTGSTEFYDTPATDPFTPSYLEAGLLEYNVGRRRDGSLPSWIKDPKRSAIVQYVEWFNGIWHTGDPSLWNATVFTNTAVIIDPTGVSRGAQNAANSFLILFKYYPELRGEVVSWAANDREIIINWRFRVKQKSGGSELLVPVIDKFCFRQGCVSHRLAYFDILTFIGYLTDNYGQGQLTDYLRAAITNAETTGGIQNVPSLIWRVIKGLFVWPADVEMYGLRTTPGDGRVTLTWEKVKDAVSYKVNRSTDLAGPFELPPKGAAGVDPSAVEPAPKDAPRITYVDTEVTNGVTYWYLVSPNFQAWAPTPVLPEAQLPEKLRFPRRRRRHGVPYGVSRGQQAEPVPPEEVPYSEAIGSRKQDAKPPSDN